jgi:hypothetical protein
MRYAFSTSKFYSDLFINFRDQVLNFILNSLKIISQNECLESNPDDFYCSTKQAYNPVVYKVYADHILPMQVPGHWYGDKREFNFLTVLNTTKQKDYFENKFDGYEEDLDNYKSMATTGAFAELTAQAYYLGFSMWKDLTYPLRGQYVLSNGQDFCFADYQLNTLNLWNPANKLKNVCSLNVPERYKFVFFSNNIVYF